MDVQYAVGRIYFPKLEDYARYAQSVADAENGRVSLARKAVFFGTAHKGDDATEASAENLVKPLHEYINVRSNEFELGWSSQLVEPKDASRSALMSLLGGSQTPALLFTATHGMSLPYNHPQQARFQGGLLCQDWIGPGNKVGRTHFMAAEDLPETSNLAGSVVFHFACFGAGTPYWDEFAISNNSERAALAVRPFLSQLPMRLLSNPGGGALAVVGHVERAWTHSFSQGKLKSQTQAYQSLLFNLMDGKPIGMAMDDMNVRYAQIASTLAYNLGELKYNKNFISQFELALQWASTNDARGYAILGDPAVKIAVGATGTASDTRPTITLSRAYSGALPVVFTPEALVPLSAAEQQQAQSETQALQKANGSFSVTGRIEENVENVEVIPDANSLPPVTVEVEEKTPNNLAAPNDLAAPDNQPSTVAEDLLGPGMFGGGGPSQPLINDPVILPSGSPPGANGPGSSQAPRQPVDDNGLIVPPVNRAGAGQAYITPVDALAMALQVYDSNQPAAFSGNILEEARDKVKMVVVGLNSALVNLAASMQKMTDEATTLTVTTGVIEDLKHFDPSTADPRFVTTISLGGDVKVFVPRQAQEVDEMLLVLHKEMVNQAMANRLAFIKALGETVTTLFAGPKS
jgi:hypothetical protein